MLRNAISEYQVGSGSVTQLIAAIAAINNSMNSSGRGRLTEIQVAKLLENYHADDVPGIIARIRQMTSGGSYAAQQTDFDHSSIDSIYGAD